MTEEEKALNKEAIEFVKRNRRHLFERLLGGKKYKKSDNPLAVFMAGTPGAGKTEVSKNLLSVFDIEPVRIDADELREFLPGYSGANSYVLQSAASLAVDKVLDVVVHKELPFILDATFAVGKATANIKHVLRKGYEAQVYFIHQDPVAAWNFTKVREQKEGRFVPKDAFINAYFASRENVKRVKEEFGDKVKVRLIIKNYQTDENEVIEEVDDLAKYLPKPYTKKKLESLLQ